MEAYKGHISEVKNKHISHVELSTSERPPLDRVSVPSGTAVDISDGTQWRGTEFTCTCFLCKF